MEYLNGNREQPIWGIGSNDYLCENQNEEITVINEVEGEVEQIVPVAGVAG